MVSLNAAAPLALICGVLFGLGLWLAISTVPRIGRARLVDRVAPYVTDVSAEARSMLSSRASDPGAVFGVVLAPVLARARRGFGQVLGGSEVIGTRLRQAGAASSVERFRASQIVWAAAGFATALALVLVAPAANALPVIVQLVIPLLGAALGMVVRDWLLQRSAKRRLARISEELPTVLEFLTLSLTAGESMLDAVRRLARVGSGELPRELAQVVASVATGVPLGTALGELRTDLDHPAFSRAVDQVLGALERGAPLATVLRAQAGDARDEAKRHLIELAGQKEILMLVPLVFLILPVTIAFALFPGLIVLQAGF